MWELVICVYVCVCDIVVNVEGKGKERGVGKG